MRDDHPLPAEPVRTPSGAFEELAGKLAQGPAGDVDRRAAEPHGERENDPARGPKPH